MQDTKNDILWHVCKMLLLWLQLRLQYYVIFCAFRSVQLHRSQLLYMIGYLDIDNYASIPVKPFMSSLSSMTLPLWLREGIEEREGTTQKRVRGTVIGVGPSFRGIVDDRKAKKSVAQDFKFSHSRLLLSRCNWVALQQKNDFGRHLFYFQRQAELLCVS
jgi:hypothetical protein